MIRKLLKVEFRDALSSMLPIGVGMVALSALVALTSVLTGRLGFYSGHWDWLNALLSFATGVCFIAVLVVCFAANVNRFFRMLGEEGYVQLVLPATMGQHIAAKLIAAVATTLLTFVFLAACTFLMALPTSVNAFAAFLRETGSAIHSLGLPASLLLALFVVLGIISPSQSAVCSPSTASWRASSRFSRCNSSRRFCSCWLFTSPRRTWRPS